MKTRHIFPVLFAVFCLTVQTGSAQELWTSAGIKKTFGKHWGVGSDFEYRTHDGLSSTERWTFGVSGEYKHSCFKVDAGYKYIYGHTLEKTTQKGNIIPPYWIGRHRAFVSLAGKLKVGSFDLSLRERYQFSHRDGKYVPKLNAAGTKPKPDEWIETKNEHMLRSRLACEYNIRKSRFTPFATVELYDNLGEGFAVEKLRYTLGTECKITKHNRAELFYRYIQGVENRADNAHVIGVGYLFKL